MPVAEYYQSKMALGSDTTLVIVTDKGKTAAEAIFAELWLTIFRFEQRFSRFLPNSELTQFNQRAGLEIPVSDEFFALLLTVQRLSTQTEGLYNPFILPALQRAGYLKSAVPAYVDESVPDFRNRALVSAGSLLLGDGSATIPYGTALDFGGCGKGYLAGLLADHPLAQGLRGFWFSLGGDIIGRGTNARGESWKINIQDAHRPDTSLARTIVGDPTGFAVATSGTIIHGNAAGRKAWHHIINPRTGKPAQTDLLLATVQHKQAVDADVLASCAVILGKRNAPAFLKKNKAIDSLLQQVRHTETRRDVAATNMEGVRV